MTGWRGAPWSARAQFRAVPVALPVLPDEACHLTPTDFWPLARGSPRPRTSLQPHPLT